MRVSISLSALVLLATAPIAPGTAWSHPRHAVGDLVSVSIDVSGRARPLYHAPDGSSLRYLEAREGARYSIRLANRTAERLGVEVVVDGLNVISGSRGLGPSRSRPGRLYILEPWQSQRIRGWRTSLSEVRRFNFVDEQISYAARSGQANSKMGWIEVAVHRERGSRAEVERITPLADAARMSDAASQTRERDHESGDRPAAKAPEEGLASREAPRHEAEASKSSLGRARRHSYPGTGWGARTTDRAILVDFAPERHAAERITLRYEYREALYALGVLPPGGPDQRLWERDHGRSGFARPPAW